LQLNFPNEKFQVLWKKKRKIDYLPTLLGVKY